MSDVAILDLGHGNLRSVALAFERLGARCAIVADAGAVADAEKLVVPGVGAAGAAMAALARDGLAEALAARTAPTLGICLGMQLFYEASEEDGGTALLGLLPGTVTALVAQPGLPVPNMGWSRLSVSEQAIGLRDGDYGWFANGYACPAGPQDAATIAFGTRTVPAAIRSGPLWGAQFHPERSSSAGASFLRAFLDA